MKSDNFREVWFKEENDAVLAKRSNMANNKDENITQTGWSLIWTPLENNCQCQNCRVFLVLKIQYIQASNISSSLPTWSILQNNTLLEYFCNICLACRPLSRLVPNWGEGWWFSLYPFINMISIFIALFIITTRSTYPALPNCQPRVWLILDKRWETPRLMIIMTSKLSWLLSHLFYSWFILTLVKVFALFSRQTLSGIIMIIIIITIIMIIMIITIIMIIMMAGPLQGWFALGGSPRRCPRSRCLPWFRMVRKML